MSSSEKDNLHAMRHSLAHIMASAVAKLWPKARFGVGPVVENGFYYDIDVPGVAISEEDFPKIEAEMRKIISEKQVFEQSVKPIDEALGWAKASRQPYKEELLNDLKRAGTTLASDLNSDELGTVFDGEAKAKEASFYTNGDFTDLCRGPHAKTTGDVGEFKLMRVAGAYWRGKDTNPQMQRLYGIAFEAKKELAEHLLMLEEAKKRDHRKLGQELDLFSFSDLVGPGLPLYSPRGTVLIEELRGVLKQISQQYGMLSVSIPHLAKIELYETSGHAQKFAGELFHVQSHYDQQFVLKPVNCPHHTQIYASRPRSYRDLPLRYIEQTMQYRDEKPGQLGGLHRTRGFTVDDGHTFCRPDQIKAEASVIVEIIKDFYGSLDLWGKHWVSLSVRDPKNQDAYIGTSKDWDDAEAMLLEVSDEFQLDAKRMEGEAAIYGPKLDFMFKDALGRETQLATIQLDFAMPQRFNLSYIDQEGEKKHPVMIHRAILGSFERFIMLIIEHYAGRFPVWLAPEQIRIVTPNQDEKVVELAKNISKEAREKYGLRVELDDTNESVGKKIRESEMMKVPYLVVVGAKELESGLVVPRVRADLKTKDGEVAPLKFDDFLQAVAGEAKSRASKSSI